MTVNIDGVEISSATIDGQEVKEITIDGVVAYTSFPPSFSGFFGHSDEVASSDETGTVTGFSRVSPDGENLENLVTNPSGELLYWDRNPLAIWYDSNGNEVWRAEEETDQDNGASVAISSSDGNIIIANDNGFNDPAIKKRSSTDGSEIYNNVISTATYVDDLALDESGNVFIGDSDGVFYKADQSDGSEISSVNVGARTFDVATTSNRVIASFLDDVLRGYDKNLNLQWSESIDSADIQTFSESEFILQNSSTTPETIEIRNTSDGSLVTSISSPTGDRLLNPTMTPSGAIIVREYDGTNNNWFITDRNGSEFVDWPFNDNTANTYISQYAVSPGSYNSFSSFW